MLDVGEEEDISADDISDNDNTSEVVDADPYDYVYSNLPEREAALLDVPDCQHCGAKKFHKEAPGFCCRSGQIQLAHHDTPLELMRLWQSSDDDARHFRDHARWFNGHFSFTSLYCSLDENTTNMKKNRVAYIRSGRMVVCTIISEASVVIQV